jgi:RNA polymerase sigma factor (sigma-70 family)
LENLNGIINGCVNKDHRYQRILYDRYRGFACKIVFRYIYRYEKAMDVVTDGFVKAFTHFDSFRRNEECDSEKQLMAWLKRIMINCAIDELRKTEMLPEIGGFPDYIWELSDKHHNADQLLLYKDLIILIKELPTNYRTVFNLYVIDGYAHSEIAEMLHISIGTSKSNLSRARGLLQAAVQKMEEGKACRI